MSADLTYQAVEAVTSALRGASLPIVVLNPQTAGDGCWHGDVDLYVGLAPVDGLHGVLAAAATLGWHPLLVAERILNTPELEVLLERVSSWSVLLVGRDGAVLNLDLVMPQRSTESALRAADRLETPAAQAAYVACKRLRKRDRSEASWAPVVRRLEDGTLALDEVLGARFATRLCGDLRSHGAPSPSTLAAGARRVRSSAWRRRIAGGGGAARPIGSLARRVARPAGSFVALAGPDGVGKSTLASLLAAPPSALRFTQVLHSRPGVLDRALRRTRRAHTGAEPHGQPPYGPWRSRLKLAYLWLDFAAGYWLAVRPALTRGALVVAERWWWDLMVDPLRHRLRPTPRAVRFLGRLVPQPDLLCVLAASPATIVARKHELSVEEVARQLVAWEDLVQSDARGALELDAASDPTELLQRTLDGLAVRRRQSLLEGIGA